MQAELSRQRLRMFIERIVNKIFAKETGALRMQQIGLFTLIYVLQDDEEPVTASRIAAMMHQSNGQVHRQLQKLLDRKLVKRERVRNKQGRGHAYKLTINDTAETRKLARAIDASGSGRRAGKAKRARRSDID
jgi:DNA-binding MarR family transcriptional regulator